MASEVSVDCVLCDYVCSSWVELQHHMDLEHPEIEILEREVEDGEVAGPSRPPILHDYESDTTDNDASISDVEPDDMRPGPSRSLVLHDSESDTTDNEFSMSDFDLEEVDQHYLEEIMQDFLQQVGDVDFDFENNDMFESRRPVKRRRRRFEEDPGRIDSELEDFYLRFCSICLISFRNAGDLDVHMYTYHREFYKNYVSDVEQVGLGQNRVERHELVIDQNVLDGTLRSYVGDLSNDRYESIFGVFRVWNSAFRRLMLAELSLMKAYKIDCKVIVEMLRPSSENPTLEEVEQFPFSSFLHECIHECMIDKILNIMKRKIDESIDHFIRCGSRWRIGRFMNIRLTFLQYKIHKPGKFIATPKSLINKNCVVNIRNTGDEMCFKWSILAGLHPIYRDNTIHWRNKTSVESYRNVPNTIFWDCLNYPTTIDQIPKFLHFNPELSVNVFGYEMFDMLGQNPSSRKDELFPLYICKQKRQTHFDLLLLINDATTHYTLLKQSPTNQTEGLSRLLGKQERNYEKIICYFCLSYFRSNETLNKHVEYCCGLGLQRVRFPDKKFRKMTSTSKLLPVPFVIYCDFEAMLVPLQEPQNRGARVQVITEHVDCGWSYVIVDLEGMPVEREQHYFGKDAANKLLEQLINVTKRYFQILTETVELDPAYRAEARRQIMAHATNCIYCGVEFTSDMTPHLDHCHITGRVRGAACFKCNSHATVAQFIPVIFHNFRSYDCHFIIQALKNRLVKHVDVIPHSVEKFLSITLTTHGNKKLRFIDSYQFMSASLDQLVSVLGKENTDKFKITKLQFDKYKAHWNLLFKKGIYPYTYMTSFEKFQETQLPAKEHFTSDLTNREISDEDYTHALEVFERFGCKNLRDYHNLYVKLDTCLLADCFEEQRKLMYTRFRLDPAHYFSLPGLAMDTAMVIGDVEYEYIQDIEMYNFLEGMVRGGICTVGLRYARANNPYMGDKYNPSEPTSYIMDWDANSLYPTVLRNFVPYKNWHWVESLENRTNNMSEVVNMILLMKDDDPTGLILECDLDYPPELHHTHNDYPCAVEKLVVDYDDLSYYSQDIMDNINGSSSSLKQAKLIQTLRNKRNYRVHYRLLKLFLRLGLKLVKVHRALGFDQAPIFKKYIDLCLEQRKLCNTVVESLMWKSMGNILAGKTIENKRKWGRVNVALSREKALQYARKPTVKRVTPIHDNCILFDMKKQSVCLDRPIFVGVTVLDDSKCLMLDFYYNYLKKKYGEKMRLCYTDTDSLMVYIKTEDVYKDLYRDMNTSNHFWFDTSNYDPTDLNKGILHSNQYKGECGKFKDEYAWTTITELIALKPKLYAIRTADSKTTRGKQSNEFKKAKGTVRCVVEDSITFDHYKQVLEEGSTMDFSMNVIRSYNHGLVTTKSTRRSLSALDDKCGFYITPLESLRFGHCDIPLYK